jgi:hypothetical protein
MFLIIILIVVLVYVAFQRVEGFNTDKMTMDKKALICYYGGSFREGNIGSTKQDSAYGYEAQKNTSITHAKLKQVLNDKGYQTDILISTRSTKYSNQLDSWYEPYRMIINKISEKMHGKDYMIQSTVENINKLNKYDYDFILFIRIDLFLKPEFFEVLDTETNKISFLAQNYDPADCSVTINTNYTRDVAKYVNSNDPKVVDLFLLLPKKYFYILDKNFKLEHWSWSYFKHMYKIKETDMQFMTSDKFDSNSHKFFNNYYFMTGRDESTIEEINLNKKCPKYYENKQKFLKNPTNYYINKYKNYYNI